MRVVTLTYCVRNSKVLFGVKKRGFGAGKLNGFGGKVEPGETILECACREVQHESGLTVQPEDMTLVARLDFSFPDIPEKNWDQTAFVYVANQWQGEPRESEEMTNEWQTLGPSQYQRMWAVDVEWLPRVLREEKLYGAVAYAGSGETVLSSSYRPLESKDILSGAVLPGCRGNK